MGEKESIQQEQETTSYPYITLELIEDIKFPEDLPKYEGEGVTSYSSKYDQQKIEFLESCNVMFPKEWISKRPLIITSFRVLQSFIVLEDAKRSNLNIVEILEETNKYLQATRVETNVNYNKPIGKDETTFQELFERNGIPCNTSQKVSPEELAQICEYISTQLSIIE